MNIVCYFKQKIAVEKKDLILCFSNLSWLLLKFDLLI